MLAIGFSWTVHSIQTDALWRQGAKLSVSVDILPNICNDVLHSRYQASKFHSWRPTPLHVLLFGAARSAIVCQTVPLALDIEEGISTICSRSLASNGSSLTAGSCTAS